MKRRMFGFQRRVWWPKWTPASSSSFRPASGMHFSLNSVAMRPAPLAGTQVLGPWAGSGPLLDGGRSDLTGADCRAVGQETPGTGGFRGRHGSVRVAETSSAEECSDSPYRL